MRMEKRKDLEHLPRERLGLGQNLEWEKVFGEKRRFGSREKRERDQDI